MTIRPLTGRLKVWVMVRSINDIFWSWLELRRVWIGKSFYSYILGVLVSIDQISRGDSRLRITTARWALFGLPLESHAADGSCGGKS